MRLASDCAQLEFALSSILGPTGQHCLNRNRNHRNKLHLQQYEMAAYTVLGKHLGGISADLIGGKLEKGKKKRMKEDQDKVTEVSRVK
jgi:hypothetical protein